MTELHAGAVSGAVWNRLQERAAPGSADLRALLRHHSHFLISQPFHPERDPDPLAVLLANLLQRGLPTLTSLRVEQELAARTGLITLDLVGRSEDTRSWEATPTRPWNELWPWVEQVLASPPVDFQPGPAPDFSLPAFDSPGEEEFFQGPLAAALGPAWPLVERQRPLTSLGLGERFLEQRADFCVEFPGITGNEARGVIIEFDGSQHGEARQAQLDRDRDAACRQAGWLVIRVPAQHAAQLMKDPELARLRAHSRFRVLQAQSAQPWQAADPGLQVGELVGLPLAVARLQAVVARALLAGRVRLEDPLWRICVVERDVSCAEVALEDLQEWLRHLLALYRPARPLPGLALSVVRLEDGASVERAVQAGQETPFHLVVDLSVWQPYTAWSEELPHIHGDGRVVVRSGLRPLGERTLARTSRRLPMLQEEPGAPLRFFLHNLFRKGAFREKQEEIVVRALRRQSTIALLPTGAGKSLTYQLAALLSNGVVLVVDPIKSLMKDQVDNLSALGIDSAAFINSTQTGRERERAGQALSEGRVKFTFISPERLLIEDFRKKLQAMGEVVFCFAVVDEAHCVSEWGHDFRTAYLRLGENLRRFCPTDSAGEVPILALTGTASHEVLGDVQRELQLMDGQTEIIKPERMARDELHFFIDPLERFPDVPANAKPFKISEAVGRARRELLFHVLDRVAATCPMDDRAGRSFPEFVDPDRPDHGSGLVFCPHVNWVHGVVETRQALIGKHRDLENRVGAYAGSLQEERGDLSLVQTQDDFKRGQLSVLACTKAFGMGIDKPDIRFTVHLNIPQSLEAFYQEAGRAGRDRQESHCCILYAGAPPEGETSVDLGLMESFHHNSFRGAEQEIAKLFDLLDRVRMPGGGELELLVHGHNTTSPLPIRCNLWQKNGPAYIYVNDLFSGTKLARLALPELRVQETHPDASEVLAEMERFAQAIREAAPKGQDLVSWLRERKAPVDLPGLETLTAAIPVGEFRAVDIPFNNGIAEDLAEFLNHGQKGWSATLVEAAYGYCFSEDEFIDNLKSKYRKLTGETCLLGEGSLKAVRKAFNILRDESQTFRAVYRLSTLGIVDDYTIDYAARVITVRLRRPPAGEITRTLREYIGRYEDAVRTAAVPAEVEAEPEPTELRRAARRLVRFVYDRIAAKRREALSTMDRVTQEGIGDPERFKERLYAYFDSRYTDELGQYLKEYSFSTPLEILDHVDTTPHDISHLLGSCDRLLEANPDNAALRLVRAVCMALRAASERATWQDLLEALRQFSTRPGWNRLLEARLLQALIERIRGIDPSRTSLFEAALARHHTEWLRGYLTDMKEHVTHEQAQA